MIRLRRTGVTVLLGLLVTGCAALSPGAALRSLAWQETPALPVEVGSGPVGDRGFGIVGRNLYDTEAVTLFGYLTALNGLDPALLYGDGSPTPQDARFTYAGEVAVASRSNRGDVSALAGEGILRVFLDDSADESWDDPASFADGEPIAEYTLRLQETTQRQAPGIGIIVGDGLVAQRIASEFSLDGERYRFGQVGIEQRFRYVGAPGDGASPAVVLTGTASVTSREAIAVRLGEPAETAATPQALTCPALQPWLSEAVAALDEAQASGEVANRDQVAATLGADAARQAAANVEALATARRAAATPPAAAEASRLVVTALSTQARGLQTLAMALENEDTDLLAQAETVLTDGERLLDRARTAVVALGESCPQGNEPAASS